VNELSKTCLIWMNVQTARRVDSGVPGRFCTGQMPHRKPAVQYKTASELRELAESSLVAEGRINELINEALAYLEKVSDIWLAREFL
jgi:hypothetical protein